MEENELLFCVQYKRGTRNKGRFFRRIRSKDAKLLCVEYRRGIRKSIEFSRRKGTPSFQEVTRRLIEKGVIAA